MVNCMVHIRHYGEPALKENRNEALWVMGKIRELYKVEKDYGHGWNGLRGSTSGKNAAYQTHNGRDEVKAGGNSCKVQHENLDVISGHLCVQQMGQHDA